MKYAFIDEHRSGFRVKKMCHVLEISQGADITHGEDVPRDFVSKRMNVFSKRSKKPIR